jgi:glycosyltransferase involved in cell wall biosynthesis
MLRGEHGRQMKELDRLVDWLGAEENKADIICLSNILLAGLFEGIKRRLDVPVICLLQDEHGFLDGLPSPYSEQAWEIVTALAGEIDAFVAVSKFYADFMKQRLALNPERIKVCYVGISLEGFAERQSEPDVPTIGFLSQTCSEKGLDNLVEAFITLKKNEKLKNARLRIAGGHNAGDEPFLRKIRSRLASAGVADDADFPDSFDPDAKQAFLRSLSLLSVPEKQPVAYGLYVFEALAAGIPVVQPATGVFPELADMLGGVALYDADKEGEYVRAIEQLLLDPNRAKELGREGRKAVFDKLNVEQTARETVRIYQEIAKQFTRG